MKSSHGIKMLGSIRYFCMGLLLLLLAGCQSEEETHQFLLACKFESVANIEAMINNEIDINAKNKQGITGLMVAAAENRPEVVELLLKHNAKPDITTSSGISALMYATARGSDIKIIKALIDAKSDVNLISNNKNSALMTAISQGEQIQKDYLPILELRKEGTPEAEETQLDQMLSAVAERNREKGQSTLMTENMALKIAPGAFKTNSDQIIEILLAAGADINAMNRDGETIFYQAVNYDLSTESIKALIKAGVDVNKADREGTTPLMLAATSGKVELVLAIADTKLDVNQLNAEGISALLMAAAYGTPEIIDALIQLGADINFVSNNNISTLMLATKYNKIDNIKALLANGANIHFVNKEGYSALGYSDAGDARQLLLDNNANVDGQAAHMAQNDLYVCAEKVDEYIFSTGFGVSRDPFKPDMRFMHEECPGIGTVSFSLGSIRFEQTEETFMGKSIQCELDNKRFKCVEG